MNNENNNSSTVPPHCSQVVLVSWRSACLFLHHSHHTIALIDLLLATKQCVNARLYLCGLFAFFFAGRLFVTSVLWSIVGPCHASLALALSLSFLCTYKHSAIYTTLTIMLAHKFTVGAVPKRAVFAVVVCAFLLLISH